MVALDTADVTTALYGAISGPAGAPRDWALHDRLLAPGACSYVLHEAPDGTYRAEVLTEAQYRASRQPYFDSHDFYEVETGHHAVVRGAFAHVLSEYESRRTPDGPAFERGVNAIMLVRLAGEWRITSIAWVGGGIAASLRKDETPHGQGQADG